jgi:hypothetical protein
MDEASSGSFNENQSLQNAYDPNGSRSVSGFDVPQVFSAAVVYDLPFGQGRRFVGKGIASHVIANWQVNALIMLRSGQPYSLTMDSDTANVGAEDTSSYARPNLVGNPVLANPIPSEWFNKAAYANPGPYVFGTSGRNQLWTQDYRDLDLSLFREDRLTERIKLQLRAEAFNFLNHPVMGIPDSNFPDATFGHVSSTVSTARQIQLGMKVLF